MKSICVKVAAVLGLAALLSGVSMDGVGVNPVFDLQDLLNLTLCMTPNYVERDNINENQLSLEAADEKTSRNFIIGGYDAKRGEFPAYAMLLNSTGHRKCGATLIGDDLLLTAAHCVVYADIRFAKLGIVEFDEEAPVYRVQEYCFVKRLDYSHFPGDIALIKLDRPIEFTVWIKPARLPEEPLSYDLQLYEAGMGEIDSYESPPENLQVLPTKRQVCSFKSDPRFLCLRANFPEFDGMSCHGDSGSGVFSLREDQIHVVHGIDSAGIEHCTMNQKEDSNYVDVYRFIPWIHSVASGMSSSVWTPSKRQVDVNHETD